MDEGEERYGNLGTKITILVDNEARAGLQPEFGLSLWVENRGTRFLFDTGQERGALLENAAQLGSDPGAADYVILSHGHYDHCGGLSELLVRGCRSAVHCHPSVAQPRYSTRNREVRPIQMPRAAMAALDHHPQELVHWVQQPGNWGFMKANYIVGGARLASHKIRAPLKSGFWWKMPGSSVSWLNRVRSWPS